MAFITVEGIEEKPDFDDILESFEVLLIRIGLYVPISLGYISLDKSEYSAIFDIRAKRDFNFSLIGGNTEKKIIIIEFSLDLIESCMIIQNRGIGINVVL